MTVGVAARVQAKRKPSILLLIAGVCAVAPSAPAFAHHGVHPQNTYTHWGAPQGFPAEGAWALQQTIFTGNDPAPGPGQVPPSYFYAHQFFAAVDPEGDNGGYIGIQTDAAGKRAVFSWWGAVDGACSEVVGAECRMGFEDRPVYQTAIPYNWQAHHYYTLTVWRLSVGRSTTRWLGAISDNGGPGTNVGYIDTPNEFGGLGPGSVSWIEWYGGTGVSCSQFPKALVYFERPSVNANQLYAQFPGYHELGISPCPSTARNFDVAGSWAVHETMV